MATVEEAIEGLDEDEALGVFQGLLSALGQDPGQAIESPSQGTGGVTGSLGPVPTPPSPQGPQGAPQPQQAAPPPPPPTVIGSMTQGPQPQNPFSEAAAGELPSGPSAGSPPPTPPPGVSAAGGGGLSGPPNSKLQRNTTDPVQAQNPIEAPGVVPTYPQPGQAEHQAAEANDPVRRAQQMREQNAQTLQRGTRAQTALTALRAMMGIAGAGMGMVGGRRSGIRRAGSALALAGNAIPSNLPASIAGARIGQREQAFQDLLAARGDVRSEEYLDQQREAMRLNRDRFGLQQDAQAFGQEIGRAQEQRAQAAETRTQDEFELTRRRQDKDSPESREARARFMSEFATIPPDQLPAWARDPAFMQWAQTEATADDIRQLTQTMQPIHQRAPRERRGGGGGGEGGAGRIGPWEQHLIGQGELSGIPRAAATDAVTRDARTRREYEQYIGQQQGRQAQEARAQADDAEMLTLADEAVEAIDVLSPGQASALMWGVSMGEGLPGVIAERTASAWHGLSAAERAEVGPARQRAITLLQKVARSESGAAINHDEWQQFRARLGLDAWRTDPGELAYMVRWYRRIMRETLAARQQAAGYVRPGAEIRPQTGDIPPPPQRFPFRVRRTGPSGQPQETTVRSSDDWDKAYEMGFRPRPGGG